MKKTKSRTEAPMIAYILLFLLIMALIFGFFVIWTYGTGEFRTRTASKAIDAKAAAYIAENYPGNDFDVSEAYYAFKSNCYRVDIQSRSSRDTYFSLEYDLKTHELTRDGYEGNVLSGYNTRTRLVEEYNAKVQEIIEAMPGAYIVSGDYCQYSENEGSSSYFSPRGLDATTLELDGEYDVGALGSQYGTIYVSFQENPEDVHIDRLLERLLAIDQALTEANIGYYVIEIRLFAGDYVHSEAEYYIYDVTQEDLHCDDPLARLQALWDVQEAKRQARQAQRENADE